MLGTINEAILIAHVSFGVFALLSSVWLFVDTLNGGEAAVRCLIAMVLPQVWQAWPNPRNGAHVHSKSRLARILRASGNGLAQPQHDVAAGAVLERL